MRLTDVSEPLGWAEGGFLTSLASEPVFFPFLGGICLGTTGGMHFDENA